MKGVRDRDMRRKSNSIKKKIFIATIYILIIQQVFFLLALNQSRMIQRLTQNSYNDFSNNVEETSVYIQNQMERYWGDIDSCKQNINVKIDDLLKEKNVTWEQAKNNKEICDEILNQVCEDVIFILKKNHVTGSFLILDTNNEKSNFIEQQGIYIKDISPDTNINNNADLLLCVGNNTISKDNSLVLSPDCEAEYKFEKNNDYQRIYRNIINNAKNNIGTKYAEEGFWVENVKMANSAKESILYCVPLLDNVHNVFGVMGVEISNDYLKKCCRRFKGINKFDSLLLANECNGQFKTIEILEGNTDSQNIDVLKLKDSVSGNVREIENTELSDYYASVRYLDIKSSTSMKNSWTVIGIKKQNAIFSDINQIKKYLFISITLSVVFSLFVCLINERRITAPIMQLVNKVKNSNAEGPIKLDKINIEEIDDLSKEIMNLSARAYNSAAKLSQILKLLNVPIGAFEYVFGEKNVFCTEGFFTNMGIEEEFCNKESIDIARFRHLINDLISNPESDEYEDIYIVGHGENKKYVQLKLISDNIRVLGIVSDETENVLERKRVEFERDYDALTGLLNRMSFRKKVEEILRNKLCNHGAVITINLDNLKSINSDYNYEYGDEYIKLAAKVLSAYSSESTIVCRRSADEFIIFTYEGDNRQDILNLVKDMHVSLKGTHMNLPDGTSRKIRSTFGIAWYPEDSLEYHELCRYSEFTMFRKKKTSKGIIGEFDKDEYERVYYLLNRNEELNKLIEDELLEYVFHPIVDVHKGRIFAYEALMRSKMKSIKSPLEVLQLATSESKLYEIERLTLFKSMEYYTENREYFNDIKIFINSIPNNMLSDKDFAEWQNKYGKEADNIVIELLENEQSDQNTINSKAEKIREIGCKLAIDDFGSGYNNESILLDVTPEFVKIDMEIVQGVERDKNREHIIKNLISYAHDRKIKVIAEGIETESQLEKLIKLGVDYGQGYYFSKPELTPPILSKEKVEKIIEFNKLIEN